LGDYTETFRLRLDLGDFGGATQAVEREVARIRNLLSSAAAVPPGSTGRLAEEASATRAAALSAVPGLRQSQAELERYSHTSPMNYAFPFGGAPKMAANVGRQIDELEAAARGLEGLPPAVEHAGRVAARVEAAARAAEANAASVGGVRAGAGSSVNEARSAAAAKRVEELAALEAADRGELVAAVKTRLAAERKINQIEEQVAREARAQMGPGGGGRGPGGTASLTQRLQAYIGGNQRDATEYRGLGQLLSSRFLTSSTFAVSGFATFQAVQTIRGMVEQAQKAQTEMARLKAQFDAVGESDSFARVSQEVNSIARDTGLATDQVAQLAGTMKGAFIDTTLAIQQTRQAAEGMQALGINNAETQNVLTASALTFYGRTGDAIRKVSDETLHLHDVFGPAAKEIAEGVANIAPLAQEMGLTFEQTATIIAGAAARSGRSATQVANEIGRALTQVEKQQIPILQLFQQGGPQAQAAVPNIAQAIRDQQPGQVLIEVTKHWHDLNDAQKETFLQMVGGRREAASLAAMLGASDDIVKELSRQQPGGGPHGQGARQPAPDPRVPSAAGARGVPAVGRQPDPGGARQLPR
jgi:TP901 family phage tail tape measure protein